MGLLGNETAYKIIKKQLPGSLKPHCGMKRKVPRTPQLLSVSFLLIYQLLLHNHLLRKEMKTKITKPSFVMQNSDSVLNFTEKESLSGKQILEEEMLKVTKMILMPRKQNDHPSFTWDWLGCKTTSPASWKGSQSWSLHRRMTGCGQKNERGFSKVGGRHISYRALQARIASLAFILIVITSHWRVLE